MTETIRLDESRVVNGWIKTTFDNYISESCIKGIFVYEDREYATKHYVAVDANIEGFGSVEIGYYPFTHGNNAEQAEAVAMAHHDLDAFVAKHGKLF